MVLQQQRQMGQKGGDFLTAGSLQVEIKADGLVNFFADAFGKLVELRAFEFLLEYVELEVCPGNEQKGKQKIVRLAMVAAGDRLLVEPVDGRKDLGKVFAASARPNASAAADPPEEPPAACWSEHGFGQLPYTGL